LGVTRQTLCSLIDWFKSLSTEPFLAFASKFSNPAWAAPQPKHKEKLSCGRIDCDLDYSVPKYETVSYVQTFWTVPPYMFKVIF
jgi:hypothetical protein